MPDDDNSVRFRSALTRDDASKKTKIRRVYSAQLRIDPTDMFTFESAFIRAVEDLQRKMRDSSVDLEDPYIITLSVQEDW